MRITILELLGGLSILLIGYGLLGTLLGVRATIERFSDIQTGLVMMGYYLGYIIGTVSGPGIVQRVGHIRTFAAFAALGAATTLMFGLFTGAGWWFLFRVLNGTAMVGLYMVVESWLNEKTPAESRGRVLAVYMITTLIALASGQFLLLVYDPATLAPFALAAILIVLAIIPIAVTRVAEPDIDTHPHLPLMRLFRLSPLGVAGAVIAGMVNGAFWSMTPVFGIRLNMSSGEIAGLMSATIVGGALLQLPIGHFSDRHDRRRILLLVSLAAGITAVVAGMTVHQPLLTLSVVAFIYGGLMFAVYAISVAHTNDHLQPGQVLGATRGLLLLYGLGAMAGPSAGGWIMDRFGPVGLPYFSAGMLFLLVIYGLYRMTQRDAPPLEQQAEFVPLTRTGPVVMEMHPLVDGEPPEDVSNPPKPE